METIKTLLLIGAISLLILQDGYFKIIRGTNECGIEEDVTAGMPSTKNLDIESGVRDDDSLVASV